MVRGSVWTMVVGLIVGAAGCGNGGSRDEVTAELGGLVVHVQSEPARIQVSDASGTILFDGLPGGNGPADHPAHTALAFRAAEASYQMQVGSFWIEETDADRWDPVASLGQVREDPDGLRFVLLAGNGEAIGTGEVTSPAEGHLRLLFAASDAAANRSSVAFACRPDEHFLGMGGQSYDVDHRGWSVPIWVSEDGISKVPTDDYDESWFVIGRRHSTHTPMPIFLSSRGYALLLDTTRRSIFHLCSEADDVVRLEPWEGAADLHLFAGPSPAEAIERLTAHLGRPEVPPAFAFAPWLDAIYGPDNVRRVAQKLRAEGVPASVIWSEDWRGATADGEKYTLDEDWRLDRELYPDFEQLAADLHAAGFKFLTYNNTFITQGVDVWDEAVAGGYTIEDADGEPYTFMSHKFIPTTLADLTDPDAWEWVKQVYREGLQQGADGWMADYAEWMPTDAVLQSLEDGRAYHNRYPVDFQRLNRELFDEQFATDGVERLFFVRSAYLGSQPLVSVVWAGDQQTDFSAGDGFKSIVPIGLGLGVCGFPYYGHDIAGYMDQLTVPSTRELWYRWASLGALSPVMRTHHGLNAAANWNWETDAETTAHFKRWARLHIRLFPYLDALADEANRTGLPMMRPLALAHPDFEPGWTATDQFMLGDRIYVAPVVDEGATSRQVNLPAGTYYPLLGGPAVQVSSGAIDVDVPVTELPAFVPAGALLVLLPEDVNSLVTGAAGSGVVSHLDAGDDREIWLYPDGDSSFTEVSGLTYTWSAAGWQGPPSAATWNGQAVELTDGSVTVSGNGTLLVDGTARLEVSGGEDDRVLIIRFRGGA